MKVLFSLFVIFMMAKPSFAQKVTEETLIGNWKMIYVTVDDNAIDFKTDIIIPGPKTLESMSAMEIEAMLRENMQYMMRDMVFAPGFKMSLAGEGDLRPFVIGYTLSEQDGGYYLEPEGQNALKIKFDNEILIIENSDGRLFKFEKQP